MTTRNKIFGSLVAAMLLMSPAFVFAEDGSSGGLAQALNDAASSLGDSFGLSQGVGMIGPNGTGASQNGSVVGNGYSNSGFGGNIGLTGPADGFSLSGGVGLGVGNPSGRSDVGDILGLSAVEGPAGAGIGTGGSNSVNVNNSGNDASRNSQISGGSSVTSTGSTAVGNTQASSLMAGPGGTLGAPNIACPTALSNCYVAFSWTARDSVYRGQPISDIGIIDNATGRPAITGVWTPGKNYFFAGANGSMTFILPPGSYTAYLWGWDAGEHQEEIASRTFTLVQGSTQNNQPSTTRPTGTLTAINCALATVGPATCSVPVTWTSQNSTYQGAPFVVMNVIGADGNFYTGQATEGTSAHTAQTANGSFNFALPAGAYMIGLYGWYNNTYALLATSAVVVGVPPATNTNTQTNTPNTTPTATLLVNGGIAATSTVGHAISYTWSSTNATSFSSSYTEDSSSCGVAGTGPFPWVATNAQGSVSSTLADCQGGHTYTITYTVRNSAGVAASASVRVYVRSDCSATFNGFCITGSPKLPASSIPADTVFIPSDTSAENTSSTNITPVRGSTVAPTSVTVSDTNLATAKPTATFAATDCSLTTTDTCPVVVSWSNLQNSVYQGAPYIAINVIDMRTNQFYTGSAVLGRSFYQAQTPSGTYSFSLLPGSYTIAAYGWYNGAYSLIDAKPILIQSGGGGAAITALSRFLNTQTASSSIIPNITHILSRGMSGSDVNQLQFFLTQKGYLKVPASGYFGPLTEEAVKEYQKDRSIEQTGIFGAASITALQAY